MLRLISPAIRLRPAMQGGATATQRLRRQHAAVLAVAFAALLYAFFPGHFDADSAYMYGQSADVHTINDAHSPLLIYLMSVTREFAPGPAILFVAQMAVWFAGLWLISDGLIASGRPLTGLLSALACLLPLTSYIFLDVNKDTAMAALGLVLIGCLTRIALFGWRPTAYSYLGLAALALAFAGMRQNALFALAPLVFAFVLLAWPNLQRAWGRGLLLSCVVVLALLSADHMLKYRVIGAHRAWGARQLVMFDLAGVTHYSGADASSGLFGPDFLAQDRACYTPKWHDPFEWGPCREDGAALAKLTQTAAGRRTLYKAWITAVTRHPVSYVRHRLAYFNQLMRISCRDCTTPMTTGAIWPRPWEPQPVRISSTEVLLEPIARQLIASPLGRGCLWLAALLASTAASLWLIARTQTRALPILAFGLSTSALAYGLAYLAIGIAYPSRYLHWMIMLGIFSVAATLAAVIEHRRAVTARDSGGPGEVEGPRRLAR